MTIHNQIREEKLQYDNNIMSALSCAKIDKYEYPTCEEIFTTYQRQIIEQAKFAYSPLRNDFEKT